MKTNSRTLPARRLAWFALFAGWAAHSAVPTLPVLHVVNRAGIALPTVVNTNGVFVTDFKGVNDVSVKLISGIVDANYIDSFGGSYAANNPVYITNFVGAATNGTGDGSVGDLADVQTSGGLSVQFDFAIPLTTTDRVFVIDCDTTEQYQIQAFTKSGSVYSPASLTGWTVQYFAGSTQTAPNGSWPAWNPASGTLTSQTGGGTLTEPLVTLAPDQNIDRVILSQTAGGSPGSTGDNGCWQFVHLLPVNLGSLGITFNGTNALVSVPANVVAAVLESSTSLASQVWTPLATNAGAFVLPVNVTNPPARFFRLRY